MLQSKCEPKFQHFKLKVYESWFIKVTYSTHWLQKLINVPKNIHIILFECSKVHQMGVPCAGFKTNIW